MYTDEVCRGAENTRKTFRVLSAPRHALDLKKVRTSAHLVCMGEAIVIAIVVLVVVRRRVCPEESELLLQSRRRRKSRPDAR